MSGTTVTASRMQIARTVHPTSFRGTPYAEFKTPDGWFIADAWFEEGEPRWQIRSSANSHMEAHIIIVGIQMAQTWLLGQAGLGRNVPQPQPELSQPSPTDPVEPVLSEGKEALAGE